MTTTNKPMTGEQLDELMTVAVSMQRECESNNDRQASIFAYAVQVAVLELRKVRDDAAALAAENAGLKDFVKTCFHAAGDGCDMDGNDIQELGERLGLFGRETYQPALHGYICGHEAGEDTVYVMNKTPATDSFLAEVRAQGVEMMVEQCELDIVFIEPEDEEHYMLMIEHAKEFAAQLRQGVQS